MRSLVVIAVVVGVGSALLSALPSKTKNSIEHRTPPKSMRVPLSDGFDFPVGAPDGEQYYIAQKFGENHHLGEDWNGIGGGDTDKGDPVTSVSRGVVSFAAEAGQGWGNVVRVLHNAGSSEQPTYVESVYGHLESMYVRDGDVVERGQLLGTIGTANGRYLAHLHFEIRTILGLPIGPGYSVETYGFADPTKFVRLHR